MVQIGNVTHRYTMQQVFHCSRTIYRRYTWKMKLPDAHQKDLLKKELLPSFSDSDIMLALESRNFDRTASEFLSRERKKLV